MNLLVHLPDVLQASIINDWLEETAEIVRLDSAFCNKTLRSEFVDMLASTYKVTSVGTDFIRGIMWMIVRGVKAANIVVQTDNPGDEHVVELIFRNLGPTATSITFEEGLYYPSDVPRVMPAYAWNNILQHCRNLTQISYERRGVATQIAQIITASSQLREVSFKDATYLSIDVLDACCASSSLESLDITGVRMGQDTIDLEFTATNRHLHSLLAMGCNISPISKAILLSTFTHLTHLSISLDTTVDLRYVAQHCRLLQKCNIDNLPHIINHNVATALCVSWRHIEYLGLCGPSNFGTVTDEALLVFIRRCPSLKRLRLVHTAHNLDTNTDSPCRPTRNIGTSFGATSTCQLVELYVHSVAADTLQTVCSLCPALCSLYFHHCPTLAANNATQALHQPLMAEQALHLLHNSNVQELHLDNAILTDEDLLNIANLECIHLTLVRGDVTIPALVQMVKQCPNLHTLTLTRPPLCINAGLVRKILDVAPKLRTFAFIPFDSSYENGQFADTGAHQALTDMIFHFYPNITELCLPL